MMRRVTDAWFDRSEGCTNLRICVDFGVVPKPLGVDGFWCPISSGAGFLIRFSPVAIIKNRRVYEATECRPASAQVQSGSDPEFQLSGPLLKGPLRVF
jgi:hypothetical protein